jgi:hypothetical protein
VVRGPSVGAPATAKPAAIDTSCLKTASEGLWQCSSPSCHLKNGWRDVGILPQVRLSETQRLDHQDRKPVRGYCAHLRTSRSEVQQRSTATTALYNTFGFIPTGPGQRKQGYKRLLRGVRDEEVAGSNPVTPTTPILADQSKQV